MLGPVKRELLQHLQGVPKESPEWYEGKEFSQRAEIQCI